jgi:hypothetical protein
MNLSQYPNLDKTLGYSEFESTDEGIFISNQELASIENALATNNTIDTIASSIESINAKIPTLVEIADASAELVENPEMTEQVNTLTQSLETANNTIVERDNRIAELEAQLAGSAVATTDPIKTGDENAAPKKKPYQQTKEEVKNFNQ